MGLEKGVTLSTERELEEEVQLEKDPTAEKFEHLRTTNGEYLNPIRQCRELENSLLHQFARKVGVTAPLLYLVERGCYNSIPGKILGYLGELGYDCYSIRESYSEFQAVVRRSYGELVKWAEWDVGYLSRAVGEGSCAPMLALRLAVGQESRVGFAKDLCVQPALLWKLEEGKLKSLPKHFTWALEEAHLPSKLIGELDERTEEFYFLSK